MLFGLCSGWGVCMVNCSQIREPSRVGIFVYPPSPCVFGVGSARWVSKDSSTVKIPNIHSELRKGEPDEDDSGKRSTKSL